MARNVKLVEAYAPDGLEDLPDPDRVFIGGSGGMLEEIIEAVDRRLKPEGLIVLNAVTLDTLTKSVEFLEDHGYTVEVTCVNIAKTRALTEYKMFEAQNPVYIISAAKEHGVMARIYAVGVGPGDPELLTRKAERIIRQAPVICAPTGAGGCCQLCPLHRRAPFLDRSRQEIIVQHLSR